MLISCPKCGQYIAYEVRDLCEHLRKINEKEVKGDVNRPKKS